MKDHIPTSEVREFVADLIEYIIAFEGIQERHRQFLLGYLDEKLAELSGLRVLSVEQMALSAALKRAERITRARNVTEKEKKILIKDLIAPYLRVDKNAGKE